MREFAEGFYAGVRMFAQVLPIALAGMLTTTVLILVGVMFAWLALGTEGERNPPFEMVGEVSLALAGVVSVATVVLAWWRVFQTAGLIRKVYKWH